MAESDFLHRLRARGEEVLTQVSAELSNNPRFMQAMAGAMRGKQKLDDAVARAVRQMNVPTRSELKRLGARIDALEGEIAALKRKSKAAPKAGAKGKPAARRPATRQGAKAAG